MTRSTELAETDDAPGAARASRSTHLRRIGVAGVAIALVMPLALPAFAGNQDDSHEPGFAAQAAEAQSVVATSTAGSPEQEAERQELYATTPAELQQLQAELQAQAEAEAQAAEQEAAAAGMTPTASTVASIGVGGSAVANAALAQVGEIQDCTQLVEDSLAAVGIPYTGMGNLFTLGPTIPASQATPGDIVYYANGGFGSAHVAVAIGDGQAVHGGWNGNQTVISGVDIPGASAPVFIDIG